MNIERDKFLTEYIGECWHERVCIGSGLMFSTYACASCGASWGDTFTKDIKHSYPKLINNNFSTWDNFGKLWNWVYDKKVLNICSGKEDFPMIHIIMRNCEFGHDLSLINPDKFADALYEYLKDKT